METNTDLVSVMVCGPPQSKSTVPPALEALTEDVLGLAIPKVVIPVAAGRNLAVLAEAAVRSTILQLRGFDTTGEFLARQRKLIESQA